MKIATKTIYEHWTDEQLADMLEAPEGTLDERMIDEVKTEIERRVAENESADRAHAAFSAAQVKIREKAETDRRRKKLEEARAIMFKKPETPLPEVAERLARHLRLISNEYYFYGRHEEAVVLDVLSMAMLEGETKQFVEFIRGGEYKDRWSKTNPQEPSVMVYFDEMFPSAIGNRSSG